MKSKTNIKAGGLSTINHNQPAALPIRTNIKAGGLSTINHNQPPANPRPPQYNRSPWPQATRKEYGFQR